MSDLISRQAAIDAVNNAFDRETLLTGFVRSIAVRAIRNMPSAQPEERTEKHTETHACDLIRRKTGVWLAYTSVPGYMFCKCAACGADILVPYTGRNKTIFNYCPNCGAEMKGEAI